jgi:hypothetical protein
VLVRRLFPLVLAAALAAPTAWAQDDEADRLEETVDDEPAPGDDAAPTDAAPPPPPAPPPRAALPPLPSAQEIKNLARADPRFARPILRRAARTAPDARRRALGIVVLARVDPTRATSRICARALRIDPAPRVRRAAAECLGRLPPGASETQTPALVAALSESEALDVRTMAGWALANVGDTSAIVSVSALVQHEDERVARLFYEYALRLRSRHGLAMTVDDSRAGQPRLVPPGDALVAQSSGIEIAASTAWMALYGGMTGWLHGGLFPAAHGGAGFQQASALTALGGAVAGVAAGGAYGFFAADELPRAQTVVQIGTAGTLAGYGFGLLSAVGPEAGLNTASYSLTGSIAGIGVGVLMNETLRPTPGALALGVATGLGAAVSLGTVGLTYGFEAERFAGLMLLTGGAAGGLTTIVAAPYEIGLLPIVAGTASGLVGAAVSGSVVGLAEAAQLANPGSPITPGAGWAVAGGYVVGAALGGGAAYLLPRDLDPFLASLKNPGEAIPVALIGGTF